MSELRRACRLADDEEILAFLERYPPVALLLFDIRSNIRRFFGDDPVTLEMFNDPEWPEDEPKLIVSIQNHYQSAEALDRIRRVGQEWWFENREGMNPPLLVTFEHVRRG